MPVKNIRKTPAGRTKSRPKAVTMKNFLEFLNAAAEISDLSKQEEFITAFVTKAVTTELLGISHKEGKLQAKDENIRKSMESDFIMFIQNILKCRTELKHDKMVHSYNYPIIALQFPKKEYKMKYLLKHKTAGK